jgi:hypothetical protein
MVSVTSERESAIRTGKNGGCLNGEVPWAFGSVKNSWKRPRCFRYPHPYGFPAVKFRPHYDHRGCAVATHRQMGIFSPSRKPDYQGLFSVNRDK